MKQPSATSNEIIPNQAAEIFLDDATQERIHKHLSDINDVITEEDIRNVKTDMSIVTPGLRTAVQVRK